MLEEPVNDMKLITQERLPIWFQAAAVLLLCGVYAIVLSWIWELDRDDPNRRAMHYAHDCLMLQMPLLLLYLAVRLIGQGVSTYCKAPWPSNLFRGFAALIAVMFLLVTLFAPPVQHLRG